MSDAHTTTSGVASPANSLVAVAAAASVLWIVGEFAIRRGLTRPLADLFGSPGVASIVTLAVTGVVLAPLVAVLGTRVGIDPADWELSLSKRGVVAGVATLPAYYVFIIAASAVAAAVFGIDPAASTRGFWAAELSTGALLALVAVNGFLTPIAEEVAWRGVVQTALTDAFGALAAIALTAVVFAAKHVIVDLGAPPMRLATLLFLAVAFGVLRHRYGTGSAMVAHVLANTTATAALLFA